MKADVIDKLNGVKTKEDLSEFSLDLAEDFCKNKNTWESQTLPEFLTAIAAWVNDMDGHYKKQGKDLANESIWKVFADILYAAKVYE